MAVEQLSNADVATRLGVSQSTWRNYVARGQAPAPDGRLGSTPWWYASTIDTWQASRRGQGWRKGQGGDDAG